MAKKHMHIKVEDTLLDNFDATCQQHGLDRSETIRSLMFDFVNKYKEEEKVDWIELKEQIGDYEGLELWKAVCHYDGHETEGYALSGPDECDFFDIDPRGMADITGGLRLPAYMPGFSLEE